MRVLVAIDGSDATESLLAESSRWLRAAHADVELLTVIDAPEFHGTLAGTPLYETDRWGLWGVGTDLSAIKLPSPRPPQVWEFGSQALDERRAARLDELADLRSRYLAGSNCQTRVEISDHVARRVLRRATAIDADAIVIGTHGRTGLRRLLVGSIAEAILRQAVTPVLVVPTSPASREHLDGEYDNESNLAVSREKDETHMHVLVAVDGSEAADQIVTDVAPWLGDAGAEVDLLTVIDASEVHGTLAQKPEFPTEQQVYWEVGADPTAVRMPPPPPPKVWEFGSQALEEVQAERTDFLESLGARHLGASSFETRVEISDHPGEAILRCAAEIGADAIVVGTHGRTGLRRLMFGSVAEEVVRHAAVPIFVIPTSPVRREASVSRKPAPGRQQDEDAHRVSGATASASEPSTAGTTETAER